MPATTGMPVRRRDRARQQFRLIESALPLAPPVQRHRHNGIEALVPRQGRSQQVAQRPRQGRDPAVFKEMDQSRRDAFVGAEAIGRVKTAKAAAAQSAAAFGIQRKAILKWRPATDAEKFG